MTPPRKAGRPKINEGLKRKPFNLTLDPKVAAAADQYWREKGFTSLSAFAEHSLKMQMASEEGEPIPSLKSPVAEPKVEPAVVHFPQTRPNIIAAAGSPIYAEVMDWNGAGDTVLVKIAGLSMEPLLHDGEVVEMRHKSSARNPHMKKGLIYLVNYDGGFLVKRYNTRKPTPEEEGEEWVENGRVKLLQSENPEHKEIIIKDEINWIAWLDEDLEKELRVRL